MIEYIIFLLIIVIIFSVLVQSYNLALGYTGILHLGHIGFYAIGAYTSALLTLNHIPFLLALLISTFFGALAGLLVGLPAIRLRGDYLALATLGFGEIIRLVALNWTDVTRGPLGVTAIPRPEVFGFIFRSGFSTLLLYLLLGGIIHLLIYKIVNSPYGRVIETIREDETASKALGKNTAKVKLQVLAISAAGAAFAGSLYAHAFNFIDPSLFRIIEMSTILIMIILGGLGSFWGPIIGTTAVYVIFEPIRFLPIPIEILGPIRRLLYALIFILIILYRPQGLIGRMKYFHKKR